MVTLFQNKVTMATKKVVETVAGNIKPPITFKEFSKDPVKGMLFIVLVAIGYLYVDIKMSNKDNAEKQEVRIEKYEAKVDTLQNQVRELISQSAASNAKMQILESLNKIPK